MHHLAKQIALSYQFMKKPLVVKPIPILILYSISSRFYVRAAVTLAIAMIFAIKVRNWAESGELLGRVA